MGGNLVLKLAGEWAGSGPAQFRAVAAVCPSVDLAASADALHQRPTDDSVIADLKYRKLIIADEIQPPASTRLQW